MKFNLNQLPEIIKIEETPIIDETEIIGWHVTTFDESGPLGGGFSKIK